MPRQTFREVEYGAWTAKAGAYDDWFAPITKQAIAPLLSALSENFSGTNFLDICAGTGHLAAAAADRGAHVEGVDFAEAMLELARRNYPRLAFLRGDAESLPYPDGSFDFAANAFGLWHIADPVASFQEAFRVLKPRGRFAFTTWLSPDRGLDLWRIVMPAIQQYGTLDVPIPAAPPPFRFADPGECERVLSSLGFSGISAVERACVWSGRTGQDLVELIYKSIVRAPLIIEQQAPEANERIKVSIIERAEDYRKGESIELRFPYLLAVATKRA